MKHIICYSGGHSSALVAVEVARRFGIDDVILLNHDINPKYEHQDIKRFKKDVADYLNLPITYANILGINDPEKIPSQFQVCMIAKAFKVNNGQELCTNRLKTSGFVNYLNKHHKPGSAIIYYGFDLNEQNRIERRKKIIRAMGYESCYPLAEYRPRTIWDTKEIGINPPCTYQQFKHANCLGCLKAGKQHWYVVYCTRPDIWEEAKTSENYIGYTIHPDESLESLETLFEEMKRESIPPTEQIPHQAFWALVRKKINTKILNATSDNKPCECIV